MTDRPLRVAILGESYLPYLSGVTVATEALARGLRRRGHEVLLVAPAPARGVEPGSAGALGPDPDVAWLPSFQAPPPAPPGYRVPWPVPSSALRAAAAFDPDVVHAQSPFVSGLMARRLARRSWAPLVFTHHTRFTDYGHYLGPLARPGAALTDRWLRAWWRGCAAIVAPGSTLAAEIRARLGGSGPPVRVIPTGIEVAELAALAPEDPRARFGWPDDAFVVVSVGRLAAEKSVQLLLDAVETAAAADPRIHLLLVGGGPEERAIRERAGRPPLAGRVALAGQLPRRDALALAAGADLFAFASRTETQGLVLAEALAVGLPVVAVGGPGVEDAVRNGEDGIVVDPAPAATRATRLGSAIGAVAADPARHAAMAAAARAGAARFDAGTRVAEVEELYRELLSARGARPGPHG